MSAPLLDRSRDAAIAAINARNARTLDRVDAAVAFVVRLTVYVLLVLGGVWALLAYLEPCAQGPDGAATLCGALLPLARFGRRQKAPPAADDAAEPADSEAAGPEGADLVLRLARDSYAAGQQDGYVTGARAGRLAGFCWGVLLGSATVAWAFYVGLATRG